MEENCEDHSVKALRPMLPGEELVTGYCDTSMTKKTRQKELQQQCGFKCQCPECSLEGEALARSGAKRIRLQEIDSETKKSMHSGLILKLAVFIHLQPQRPLLYGVQLCRFHGQSKAIYEALKLVSGPRGQFDECQTQFMVRKAEMYVTLDQRVLGRGFYIRLTRESYRHETIAIFCESAEEWHQAHGHLKEGLYLLAAYVGKGSLHYLRMRKDMTRCLEKHAGNCSAPDYCDWKEGGFPDPEDGPLRWHKPLPQELRDLL